MSTVDEYLERLPPAQRAGYERVRKIVKRIVPEVQETISYGMPTFKYRGKYLIYFGAFTNHMSIFPGTVKFTEQNPIPEATVEEMVRRRMADIDQL